MAKCCSTFQLTFYSKGLSEVSDAATHSRPPATGEMLSFAFGLLSKLSFYPNFTSLSVCFEKIQRRL